MPSRTAATRHAVLSDVFYLVLRRMRFPLLLVIGVYTFCTVGLSMIPGTDARKERPATVYMRPHEFDVRRARNGSTSFPGRVVRTHSAGAVARVSVVTEQGRHVLVELPLVAGLLRGDGRARAAWPEMPANADVGARAEVLRSAGYAPLAATPQDGGARALTATWLAEWRRRLPPGAQRDRALGAPAEWLVPRLRDGAAERAAAVEPVRRALVKLFRRHAFSPVATYAHLALVALDVERLRGGVAARSLAGPPAAGERA